MTQVVREGKRATLPLDHWHERLDRHFRSLSDARGSGSPIFALEHPLTPPEVAELSSALRKHIGSGFGLGRYWLPWIVYATEIGYGYTGDEYWHSFEEQTPGWEPHNRYSLRDRFRKFQSTYQGVAPSGPWADNFSLIAWPITHAMLPKLLQYQFASLIYQLRYQLARLDSLNSRSAGRLLASYGDETSTRFQQFLQQEELTGRILLGLLGLAPQDGPEPIYQPTLQRIIADLDAVHATRSWLKDVRRVVDRFKGIGQGSGIPVSRSQSERAPERDPDPSTYCDIRPKIFLRHAGAGTWTAVMQVANFAPVAALRSDLRLFLKDVRCRVAGSPERRPAGWVLSQNRLAVLKSWPAPGSPLLIFDKSHQVLDHLLRSDCVLSDGPLWVFRVGADGIAREILGRVVRPDADYIVLTRQRLSHGALVQACSVDCSDVLAFRLSLPQNLSATDIRWLNDSGMQIAKSIQVWPAGLPCRGWDGEGHSEWLTTEEPCFGIVHDHPVSSYAVQLNGVSQGAIPAPTQGEPIFVRLSPLPAGKHRLNITAARHGSIADISRGVPLQGFVELLVREPEPWNPGVPAHTGLIVRTDPHDADLGDLLENKLLISVAGPEGYTVDCSMSLETSGGDEVFTGLIASHMPLPVAPETWKKRFATFLDENEEAVNWRHPEATVGRLSIKAGELGEFTVRFYRDLQPVRWLTRREADHIQVRLLDDTGLDGDAECKVFAMHSPAAPTSRSSTEAFAGISLDPPGALLVARQGQHQDALIVSDGLARQGLQGLGVNPDISDVESGQIELAGAIRAVSLWLEARLAGPLAEIRRRQITTKLLGVIYARLCGKNWATAETSFLANSSAPTSADVLQHKVCQFNGFAVEIQRHHRRIFDELPRSIEWYTELARRYRVSNDSDLCEFAVRLVALPQSLPARYGSGLDKITKQAAGNSAVVRGARFAALLCDRPATPDEQ